MKTKSQSHNNNKLWKLKWRIRNLEISFWYSYHFLAGPLLRGRLRVMRLDLQARNILYYLNSHSAKSCSKPAPRDTNKIKLYVIISLYIFLKVVISDVNKAVSSKICVPVSCVSRGFSTPVYRFGCPNFVPKLI